MENMLTDSIDQVLHIKKNNVVLMIDLSNVKKKGNSYNIRH